MLQGEFIGNGDHTEVIWGSYTVVKGSCVGRGCKPWRRQRGIKRRGDTECKNVGLHQFRGSLLA